MVAPYRSLQWLKNPAIYDLEVNLWVGVTPTLITINLEVYYFNW